MSIALTILLLTVAAPAQGEQFSATMGARLVRLSDEARWSCRDPSLCCPATAKLLGSVQRWALMRSQRSWKHAGAPLGDDPPRTFDTRLNGSRGRSGFDPSTIPWNATGTVALIIVSMLPEQAVETLSTESRAVAPSASSSRSERAAGPDRRALSLLAHETTHHTSTLSGVAIAAFGMRDSGAGMGGGIDFRRALSKRLSLRVGASIRVGEGATVQAVSRFFYSGAGLAWNTWTSSSGRGAFGFRLDALAMLMEFEHLSADDAAVDVRRKWMRGGGCSRRGLLFLCRWGGDRGGRGAEVVFGRTDIFVHGRPVTTIRPVHPDCRVRASCRFLTTISAWPPGASLAVKMGCLLSLASIDRDK